ncbi:hypothetical protein HG536_0D01520 [Torulaspora globosa]|uniref:Mitochondrial transcription factor 1 n=1 Tax=Torulaspora globosa TaxID=48254 RepID=A0A7G3ZGJ4_9SACH|nr:uncharacterized protein HG536_0D01520 [Torulaspora globosa]QLL32630.1 hypothetical protein HG536_0D01520 [Torulaspora globosa]
MSLAVRDLKTLSKIKHYYGFKYVLNPAVNEAILEKLQLEKTYGNRARWKVLDLYPGPSQQAALFYNRYKPGQYAMMESRPDFFQHLSQEFAESPLEIYNKDPYEWSSYVDLIDRSQAFVPEKQSLDHINDKFLCLANLTSTGHEGLLMQWYACIGNRNWIQRFGRVKMLLWVPTTAAIKLLGVPGSLSRSKCSVVREAFTETKLVATSDTKEIKQFDSSVMHANNPIIFSNKDVWPSREKGISLLEVDPKAHDIDLDNWEYVTKHLLILKKTPLLEALDSLGHGGKDYFKSKIEDKELLRKTPGELTNDEFIYITGLFANWPFKPDIYMDFVDIYQEESIM